MSETRKTGSGRLWKISGSVVGLLALLGLLIALNILLGSARARVDITDEKLFTLSRGTRDILAKLDRPVTLKFFFSRSGETPEYLKSYAIRVEDLLREYRIAGNGRIIIEKYDPKPDSDAEELAQRYQIAGQVVGLMGPRLYMGIAAVCGTAEAVMPVLDPRTDPLLEYNLSRLIYRVANPKKPVIGVLSSLPVMGMNPPPYAMMPGQPRPQAQPPWLVFRDLKQDFDVREIEPSAETIPPEVDVLIAVHPKRLSDKTLYALDQFVLRGGRLLAFLDPLSLVDQEGSAGGQPFVMAPTSSDLGKLLDAWGIKYDPAKVVSDLMASTRIRGRDNQVEDNPVYLSLMRAGIQSNDAVTAQIHSVLLALAGAFTGEGAEGVSVTPLLTTSPKSDLVDAMSAQFGVNAIRKDLLRTGGKPLNLAVRLSGKFKTAFPNGRPVEKEGSDTNETASVEGLKESARETSVILVGDVDMLFDAFWARSIPVFGTTVYEPFNENANFFGNALELLAGSTAFVNIRCRGKVSRPFHRVLQLEREAQERWLREEEALQGEVERTQKQINELQGQKDEKQRFILSPEQEKAIKQFTKELQSAQRRLRDVRKNLREGIERLGAVIKIVNIAMMPLLVSIAGVGFWLYRRSRSRQ